MRVRRNKAPAWPSRLAVPRVDPDAALNQIALDLDVVAAEVEALQVSEATGWKPWLATPSGLVGPDYAHVLLEGVRSFESLLDGAALYDPVRDEVVLVSSDDRETSVAIGSLNLIEFLCAGRGWRRRLADLVELALEHRP